MVKASGNLPRTEKAKELLMLFHVFKYPCTVVKIYAHQKSISSYRGGLENAGVRIGDVRDAAESGFNPGQGGTFINTFMGGKLAMAADKKVGKAGVELHQIKKRGTFARHVMVFGRSLKEIGRKKMLFMGYLFLQRNE